MKNADIKKLVEEYIRVDEEVKRLERNKNKLKESIISLGEGVHCCNLGHVSVTCSSSKRISSELLKEKFGEDQLQDCYSESQTVTVRISLKKEDQ